MQIYSSSSFTESTNQRVSSIFALYPRHFCKLIGGKSAQLCDIPAERPASVEAIIQEARSKRLPPGRGELPLCELLAELPDPTAISVEVPMEGVAPPELRAQQIYDATQHLFESCRRVGFEDLGEKGGEHD